MAQFISSIIFLIIMLVIAFFIGRNAEKRGMNGWLWGIVVFIYSVFGVILYFIMRKPLNVINSQQSNQSEIPDFIKNNGYKVEYRDNLAVKGFVILFESEEYEIVDNYSNKIELKLVIPTKVRVLNGLIMSAFATIISSLTFGSSATILVGIFFLLLSIYIVEAIYKSIHKNITKKINDEVNTLLSEQLREKNLNPDIYVNNNKDIKNKPKRKYKEIGGWLMFLCYILTFFSPMATLANIFITASELNQNNNRISNIFIIDVIFLVLLIFLSIRAGISLWQIEPKAIKIAKKYLLILMGYLVICTFISVNFEMINNTPINIMSIIYAGIWYWYLSVSKRVKSTYVFD